MSAMQTASRLSVVLAVAGLHAGCSQPKDLQQPWVFHDSITPGTTKQRVVEMVGEPYARTAGYQERFLIVSGQDDRMYDRENGNKPVPKTLLDTPGFDMSVGEPFAFTSQYLLRPKGKGWPKGIEYLGVVVFSKGRKVSDVQIMDPLMLRKRIEACRQMEKQPTLQVGDDYFEQHPGHF